MGARRRPLEADDVGVAGARGRVLLATAPFDLALAAVVWNPVAGALAIIPAPYGGRAAVLFRMWEYSALATRAKEIAALGPPIRSIDSAFALPPGCNAEFLYLAVGGRLDPQAP